METSLMHNLGRSSLQKYKFGDAQNVGVFFTFQIFFTNHSNLGLTQPKIDYLRQEMIGYYLPTYRR